MTDAPAEPVSAQLLEPLGQALQFFALFFAGRGSERDWFIQWPAVAQLADEMIGAEKAAALPPPDLKPLEAEKAMAKLFYGVGEETIPLSESAWFNPQHLSHQAQAFEVDAVYRRHKLALDVDATLPPDHILYELIFAGTLLRRNEPGAAADFIERHIRRWVPLAFETAMKNPASEAIRPVILRLLALLERLAALPKKPA